MTKRVLEISVRADLGGGPKHLLDLLTCNKSDIELFSAIPFGYDYSDKIISKSKAAINIPHRNFSILSFIKIVLFCKKYKVKTVHSHGRGAGYYSRLLKLFGFKVIHTLHGVHVEDGIVNKVKVTIDQLLTPFTDLFICVSNGEKKKALDYQVVNPVRVKVIFNGVLSQEPTQFKSNIPQVAMLGRLSHPKGYDLLISAIEDFCLKSPEIEFQINIAGDGEEKEKLTTTLSKTKYTKEKINFIGKTTQPIEFLKGHTHFLSFSRFEGMPISVLEAMSIGLPCMVSDVVGNNDIINNDNGYLFNPESFNKVFKNFILSEHSSTIKTSLNDIKNKFNIETQTKLTLETY